MESNVSPDDLYCLHLTHLVCQYPAKTVEKAVPVGHADLLPIGGTLGRSMNLVMSTKLLRPNLGEEYQAIGCANTQGVVEGIVESIGLGPNSVANSLSCSNRSLDQGEELGGRELRRG
jgi:hypothetical protein